MVNFTFSQFVNCRRVAGVAFVLAFLWTGSTGHAQQVLRIAAVVNDRVISALDVVNRLKFVIWSTGVPNTPENRKRLTAQILRNLIDEELQAQEADRLNVSVSEKDVDDALAKVAERNEMSAEGLSEMLRRSGVAESTLRRQLRVQIAWGRAISRRLRREIRVSDDEVDAEMERIEALRNQPQYRVSEIFLSVDDPDQDEQIRKAATRLVQQIREGADFAAIASAFSQSTSAATGGNIGWIQAGRLSSELDEVLLQLEPGEISQPIRTLSGYYILKLQDIRQPDNASAANTIVDLHQIVLPDAGPRDDAVQKAFAEDVRAALTGCEDMPKLIEQIGTPESGSLGKLRIKDLPPQLRDAIKDLKIGEPSAPMASAAGRILIVVVCERIEPKQKPLQRRQVRRQLENNKAELLARRYLRDLRRSAFVDFRG